jgi:hypothetical protein
VVAGWLEAGDMSEEYSVDGSDEDGDACDVSTVSDEPDVDGADESEMAEAFESMEKMVREAQIVFYSFDCFKW